MKLLGRVLRYLQAYQAVALGTLLSVLLVTAADLAKPQLLRWVIDSGITAGSETIIVWGAAALLAVTLLQGLGNFTQSYWGEKVSQGVARDLRQALFAKIQTLGFSYHNQARTGQLMTRATSDVEMVRQFTGLGLFQLFNAAIMFAGSAVLLCVMNWRLALVTLATIPVLGLVFFRFIRSFAPLSGKIQDSLSVLNTVLQENLAGMRVVKAFAREPFETRRFDVANEEYQQANMQVVRIIATNFPLIFLIAQLGTIAVIWVGGLQVIDGNLRLGELVAFSTYLSLLLTPVFMIGMIAGLLVRAATSAGRVFEVLDATNDVVEKPDAVTLPQLEGRVVFEKVGFRYPGQEQNAIDNISLTIHPGQTVAITGPVGSGKSTLVNLLPRFYDVTQGRVLVDGYDVRDVTLDSLRSQIGIVLQESVLFSGTVRENIAYGRPEASLEEIIEVAKAAQAHDFIMRFSAGYDTVIGERGVGLSGGQRQRLAIARALLIQPRILILDDSTSAVDAKTEDRIQRALDKLMEEPTCVVIAHRISTVQNAHLILVLDQGRIAAMGTHETLLRKNNLYAQIVRSQLQPGGSQPSREQ